VCVRVCVCVCECWQCNWNVLRSGRWPGEQFLW